MGSKFTSAGYNGSLWTSDFEYYMNFGAWALTLAGGALAALAKPNPMPAASLMIETAL